MNIHIEGHGVVGLFSMKDRPNPYTAILDPLFSPVINIGELCNGGIPHEKWENPAFVTSYFHEVNRLENPLDVEKIMRLARPQYSINSQWTPKILQEVVPACITADRHQLLTLQTNDDNMRFNTLIATLRHAIQRNPKLAPDQNALRALIQPHIAQIPTIPLEPSLKMIQERVFEGLPPKKQPASVFGFITTLFQ